MLSIRLQTIQSLYSRTLEDIYGISEKFMSQLSELLAKGNDLNAKISETPEPHNLLASEQLAKLTKINHEAVHLLYAWDEVYQKDANGDYNQVSKFFMFAEPTLSRLSVMLQYCQSHNIEKETEIIKDWITLLKGAISLLEYLHMELQTTLLQSVYLEDVARGVVGPRPSLGLGVAYEGAPAFTGRTSHGLSYFKKVRENDSNVQASQLSQASNIHQLAEIEKTHFEELLIHAAILGDQCHPKFLNAMINVSYLTSKTWELRGREEHTAESRALLAYATCHLNYQNNWATLFARNLPFQPAQSQPHQGPGFHC